MRHSEMTVACVKQGNDLQNNLGSCMPIFCSEGRVIKRQSDLDSSCLYCWTGRIEIIVEEVAPEMVIMGESYIAKREYGLGQTRAKFW